VNLGLTEFSKISSENHSISFSSADVDVSHLERRVINNVALLVCVLEDEAGVELTRLQSVVAIDEREGVMYRTIFSPFQ